MKQPAYRFSNNRRFQADERTGGRGLYGTPILGNLLLETPFVPADMHQPTLLLETGGALGQES